MVVGIKFFLPPPRITLNCLPTSLLISCEAISSTLVESQSALISAFDSQELSAELAYNPAATPEVTRFVVAKPGDF